VIPNTPDWGSEGEAEWGILNTAKNGLHYRGKIETIKGNYAAFYENVFDVLRKGEKSLTAASDVIYVIQIIEAAFQSSSEKQVVRLT